MNRISFAVKRAVLFGLGGIASILSTILTRGMFPPQIYDNAIIQYFIPVLSVAIGFVIVFELAFFMYSPRTTEKSNEITKKIEAYYKKQCKKLISQETRILKKNLGEEKEKELNSLKRKFNKERERLRSQLGILRNEKKDIKRELDEIIDDRERLKQIADQNEQKLKDREAENKEAEQELSQIQEDKRDLKDQVSELRKEAERKQQKNKADIEKIEKEMEKIEAAKERVEQDKNRIEDNYQEQIEDIREQISDVGNRNVVLLSDHAKKEFSKQDQNQKDLWNTKIFKKLASDGLRKSQIDHVENIGDETCYVYPRGRSGSGMRVIYYEKSIKSIYVCEIFRKHKEYENTREKGINSSQYKGFSSVVSLSLPRV